MNYLHTAEASIPWNDKRMKWLGSNLNYIDFVKVLEGEMAEEVKAGAVA